MAKKKETAIETTAVFAESEPQPKTTTTITQPDLSALPKHDWSTMMITVTDAPSAERAAEMGKAAGEYIKRAEALFAEPVSAAHKVHKFLTGLRAKVLAPAELVKSHCEAQVTNYVREQRRQAEELQRKLQAEAEAAAKEQERQRLQALEEERKRQEEERMPWEIDEPQAPPPPPPPPVYVPPVVVAPPPLPAGVDDRFLPWSFEITDFAALVLHVAGAVASGDRSALDFLLPNEKRIREAAREKKERLSEYLPGVKGLHESKVRL